MSGLAQEPWLQTLGWALLHALWEGLAIAGLLALGLKLIDARRSRLRYGLALAALCAMVALPVGTAWWGHRPLAPAPALELVARAGFADAPAPASVRASTPPAASIPDWLLSGLALGWLLGLAVGAVRLLWDGARLRALVHGAEAAPEPWRASLEHLARRMRVIRPVRLLRSSAVAVPCALGWLRPAILLPASALTGLAPDALTLVLAHELAHLRRQDFMVNLLQRWLEALLFFHPAAYWVSAVIRAEREGCCDDEAVQSAPSPATYARALVALEELRKDRFAEPALMGALGASLTHRVHRLMGVRARCGVGGRIASALPALGALLLAAPIAVALAQHPQSARASADPQALPLTSPVTVAQLEFSVLDHGHPLPRAHPKLAILVDDKHGGVISEGVGVPWPARPGVSTARMTLRFRITRSEDAYRLHYRWAQQPSERSEPISVGRTLTLVDPAHVHHAFTLTLTGLTARAVVPEPSDALKARLELRGVQKDGRTRRVALELNLGEDGELRLARQGEPADRLKLRVTRGSLGGFAFDYTWTRGERTLAQTDLPIAIGQKLQLVDPGQPADKLEVELRGIEVTKNGPPKTGR